MKRDDKLTCVRCKKSKPRREIKRINGLICKQCIVEKRKEHREFLKRKICGIRKKADQIKEWKEKREAKEKNHLFKKLFKKNTPPKMKGEKKLTKSKQIHFYLTRDEKKVLYFKCKDLGMDSNEANNKIKKLNEEMNKLAIKLRTKIKDEKELNQKFKEEFAKMCEDLR